MKRLGRSCLWMALALLLLGGALMGAGTAMGGESQMDYTFLGAEVSVTPLGFYAGDRKPRPAALKMQRGETAQDSLAAFTDIDVDIALGDVEVLSGPDYGIELRGGVSGYALSWADEDGTLTVRSTGRGELSQLVKGSCTVTILLPEDAVLEEAKLHTDLGDILWSAQAQLEEAEADTKLGDVSWTGEVQAGKLSLSTNLGSVSFAADSTARSAAFHSDLGAVTVGGLAAEELTAGTSLGEVCLDCTGMGPVCYELSADLGKVYLNGAAMGSAASGGAGKRTVNGYSNMGDVRLSLDS